MTRQSKAERDALNRQIEDLCEQRGYKFKPWEWPRPWHDGLDGPPHPDDRENTRKARRLRAQLIAEIRGGDGSPKSRRRFERPFFCAGAGKN
jgi:hypothetical protein